MEAPDTHEMYNLLRRRAALRSKIWHIDLEIKQAEIPVRKSSPRKPELRDEVTMDLQHERLGYISDLEEVDASIEYINFYLQVWKSQNYNTNKVNAV